MKRICCVLALCLMLSGCGPVLGSSYVSIQPHEDQGGSAQSDTITASDYRTLCDVLEGLVSMGTERAVIIVGDYNQNKVAADMETAVRYISDSYPLGAYAVEAVSYEIGLSGGVPAVSINISYLHGRSELLRIQTVADMDAAADKIGGALADCDTGLVLLVAEYEEIDLAQLVADYADQNPHIVMETPQVAAGLYPETGDSRVVELNFTYQNSRDALRQMRSQVQPVFSAATLYVSGDGSELQKYYQLYAFLMERYDYTLETSITPSYSLLRHGVGDSKAFATVYSAMCRQAGLECMTITGTRGGEPWYWNMVYDEGYYYHVDLLRSSSAGRFREMTDMKMTGYVWDYSAYPEAAGQYVPPAESEDPTEHAEEPA